MESLGGILLICSMPKKLRNEFQFFVTSCLPTPRIVNEQTGMIGRLESLIDIVVTLLVTLRLFGLIQQCQQRGTEMVSLEDPYHLNAKYFVDQGTLSHAGLAAHQNPESFDTRGL